MASFRSLPAELLTICFELAYDNEEDLSGIRLLWPFRVNRWSRAIVQSDPLLWAMVAEATFKTARRDTIKLLELCAKRSREKLPRLDVRQLGVDEIEALFNLVSLKQVEELRLPPSCDSSSIIQSLLALVGRAKCNDTDGERPEPLLKFSVSFGTSANETSDLFYCGAPGVAPFVNGISLVLEVMPIASSPAHHPRPSHSSLTSSNRNTSSPLSVMPSPPRLSVQGL